MDVPTVIAWLFGLDHERVLPGPPRQDFEDTTVAVYTRAPDEERDPAGWLGALQEA
jgi:hypothetical protein